MAKASFKTEVKAATRKEEEVGYPSSRTKAIEDYGAVEEVAIQTHAR